MTPSVSPERRLLDAEFLTRDEYAAEVADMRGRGYHDGAPSMMAALEDEAVIRKSACDACGARGLRYAAFHRRASNQHNSSYRAFGVCNECGAAVEF